MSRCTTIKILDHLCLINIESLKIRIDYERIRIMYNVCRLIFLVCCKRCRRCWNCQTQYFLLFLCQPFLTLTNVVLGFLIVMAFTLLLWLVTINLVLTSKILTRLGIWLISTCKLTLNFLCYKCLMICGGRNRLVFLWLLLL